jgi:anti-anti-sigma regulatory factor
MAVQEASEAHDTGFVVLGARRNGIDRLFLMGALDRSSVLILESELLGVAHPDGAVILDLSDLLSIDAWGLHTLERAAEGTGPRTGRLSIVNAHGPVLDAFERAGIGHLVSGDDVSDLLDAGDGEWSPISLPPLLRRRVSGRPQVARERP